MSSKIIEKADLEILMCALNHENGMYNSVKEIVGNWTWLDDPSGTLPYRNCIQCDFKGCEISVYVNDDSPKDHQLYIEIADEEWNPVLVAPIPFTGCILTVNAVISAFFAGR